jgi:hypothetical protein
VPISKKISSAADAAIVAAGITAGKEIAKNIPSTSGKIAAVAGGAVIGTVEIIGKNIAGNVSENIGSSTKKFISSNEEFIEFLKSLYGLTGNDGLDLLYLVNILNFIEVYLIISSFHILFCLYIDENKLREILLKINIIPLFMINYYMRIFKIIKRNGFILILILLILSLISNYLAQYYLSFFIENIDAIVKIYFK